MGQHTKMFVDELSLATEAPVKLLEQLEQGGSSEKVWDIDRLKNAARGSVTTTIENPLKDLNTLSKGDSLEKLHKVFDSLKCDEELKSAVLDMIVRHPLRIKNILFDLERMERDSRVRIVNRDEIRGKILKMRSILDGERSVAIPPSDSTRLKRI